MIIALMYCSRGKNISLKLMWDHMPVTGRLYVRDENKSNFILPSQYVSNQPATGAAEKNSKSSASTKKAVPKRSSGKK